MFKNREQAGKLLAAKLREVFQGRGDEAVSTVVVGLLRGGVPVAKEVAQELNKDFSLLVSAEIEAPFQPKFAIGAVTSTGQIALSEHVCYEGVRSYIDSEKHDLIGATKALETYWLQAAGIEDGKRIKNKRVILVDDGVGSGVTTLAAVRSLKASGARQVIVATPVISLNARRLLKEECDEVVSVMTAHDYPSTESFYTDYHKLDDREVIENLRVLKSST